jgi:hypothetical protein
MCTQKSVEAKSLLTCTVGSQVGTEAHRDMGGGCGSPCWDRVPLCWLPKVDPWQRPGTRGPSAAHAISGAAGRVGVSCDNVVTKEMAQSVTTGLRFPHQWECASESESWEGRRRWAGSGARSPWQREVVCTPCSSVRGCAENGWVTHVCGSAHIL